MNKLIIDGQRYKELEYHCFETLNDKQDIIKFINYIEKEITLNRGEDYLLTYCFKDKESFLIKFPKRQINVRSILKLIDIDTITEIYISDFSFKIYTNESKQPDETTLEWTHQYQILLPTSIKFKNAQ